MRTIVVGTDGSEGAATAVRWADREAALHHSSLAALFAWDLLGQPGPTFVPDFDEDDARRAVGEWLAAAGVATDIAITTPCDLAVAALVDASVDADLVVVGSRGRGGFAELLLGSVSTVVAERALCPVAVVRGPGHPTGPVVVGVDGSTHAHRPLQWAANEARARDVPLELVHAWQGAGGPAFGLPVVLPLPHAEEAAEHELTDAMASVDLGGLVVHRHVVNGTAAAALFERSKAAGVVVVGSRGRGGLTSILLGSTSRHLLHHAAGPVVVVR